MTTNCNDRTQSNPFNCSKPLLDERMVIRPAAIDDLPEILKLIHEKAAFAGCPESVTATTKPLQTDLFDKVLEVVLLVEIEDKIAGFATYYSTYSTFLAKPGIWLDDLYLKPEFRGQGIGQKLVQYLCHMAQQTGCERIDWTVATDNDRGIRFYQKMGATVMDTVRLCRLDKQTIAQQASRFQQASH